MDTPEKSKQTGDTENIDNTLEEVFIPGEKPEDPTESMLSVIGVWLVIAFLLPILGTGTGSAKLLFYNIEILLSKGAAEILKIQVIYPLIAGFLLLFLARRKRSTLKAAAILAIGLLPFFLLLDNNAAYRAFNKLVQLIPGGFFTGAPFILTAIAMLAILAGAHASRVRQDRRITGYLAMGGAILYLLLLFIPLNGEFPFLAPINSMSAADNSANGTRYHAGVAALISMLLMGFAAYRCLLLRNRSYNKKVVGESIWRLWYAHLYVYGAFFIYIMLLSIYKSGSKWGTFVVALVIGIVKFVPWVLGLYILIPIGISEFMLQGTPPPEPQEPVPAYEKREVESSPPKTRTAEHRLHDLQTLRQKDLITDEDYEQKKAEILEEL